MNISKKQWQDHIKETFGTLLIRHNDKTLQEHMKSCEKCQARIRQRNRERIRKDREEALKSLGLTKVRGALGGVYWE